MSKHWASHDGSLQHPDSPAGGCGPGNSRVPGALDCHDSAHAHPDAPAARHGHGHPLRHDAAEARRLAQARWRPASPIPAVEGLREARARILGWIATDEKPRNEWGRLPSANPNSPEHNLRVTYCINYALLKAGVRPHVDHGPKENAALAHLALRKLTGELRRSDQHRAPNMRIGSSEALFLRDAQRYLYGLEGEEWLHKDVEEQNPAYPKWIVEHSSGTTIDRIYNVGKGWDTFWSAVIEEATGTSPGFGRSGTAKLPLSARGGSPWFDLGLAHHAAHPEQGPNHRFNLLLTTVPKP
jgi:hypothetical protein